MADDEIRIKTTIDNTAANKGLNDLEKNVKKTRKSIDDAGKSSKNLGNALTDTGTKAGSLSSAIGSVVSGFGGFAAGAGAVVAASKQIAQVMRQTTDAYKIQEKAEVALETAARNNPYIDGAAVAGLKKWASEFQSLSNYGDEAILKLMSQLTAAGRTQKEIQDIIKAAADLDAGGVMSMDSAVQALNATYGGLTGTLGKTIPALRNLTEEELRSGKAVEIVSQQYKGLAENLADSKTQAENAKGDFQEALGKIFDPVVNAWDGFWKNFYEKGTDVLNKISHKFELIRGSFALEENVDTAISTFTNTKTGEQTAGVKYFTDAQLKTTIELLEAKKKLSDEEEDALERLKIEASYRERNAQYEAKVAAAAEDKRKSEERAAQARAKTKTADDYAIESNKKLKDELAALELRAKVTGEQVTAQDKYNVVLQNYMDLMTKTEGLIKEGYPVEQARLDLLKELRAEVEAAASAEERLAKATEYTNAITAVMDGIKKDLSPAQSLKEQIAGYETLKKKLKEYSDAEVIAAQAGSDTIMSRQQLIEGLNEAEKAATMDKVNAIAGIELSEYDKRKQRMNELLDLKKEIDSEEVLSEQEKIDAMSQIDEAYQQTRAEQFAARATEIKNYTDQAIQIAQQAASIMLETVRNQTKAELSELELKYRKGEISEKEYEEAMIAAKRKGAQEEYKIQMFQWAASLAQATANIAEGVSKAIAQGGLLGILSGALVSAAGAVQIASIIASKPSPPSFSTGGFLTGNSTRGDKIPFNGNAGEAILNPAEMRNFMDYANGTASTDGLTIIINNSAANLVTAEPEISRDKIELMIDARVNESLKEGRYNQSLTMAEQSRSGEFYGI